ncbi:MAG: hypothetical protein ACD_22C00253G0005 [uncultured bacterium]|nr:MAG: hypothetical protein ACD_22C00253G0005 [uncultured bacterium]
MDRVSKIYSDYKITPNLQKHMTWVAGVANLIMANWQGEFNYNKKAILHACLFHDIAKIISFKTFKDDEYKLQTEFVAKYGDDEHVACNRIVLEVGLLPDALEMIQKNNIKPFVEKVRGILNSDDYSMKILKYADSRISPQGIVTLKGRFEELQKRREVNDTGLEKLAMFIEIEKQIQEKISIDLQKIEQKDIEFDIDGV